MFIFVKTLDMGTSKFKKYILLTSLSLMFFLNSSTAQDYNSSVGIRLGTYISTSFTHFLSPNKSIEAIAGITREANQSELLFGGFYKIHFDITQDLPTFNCYIGAGVFVNIEKEENNKPSFAPGGMIGMEYSLEETPVNFFIDISPNYNLSFGPKFNIHASIGVRYILSHSESIN